MRSIHPQEVQGDPSAVRWVVHTGTDDVVGEIATAPGPFGQLLRDGVISLTLLEVEGIWTWLRPGRDWDDWGHRVRDAIAGSLDHSGWEINGDSADLLRLVASDVVDNDLASVIETASTTVQVVENDATWLLLDLGQLEERDPTAAAELQQHIELLVRLRYPPLARTSRVGGPAISQGPAGSQIMMNNTPRRALWTGE